MHLMLLSDSCITTMYKLYIFIYINIGNVKYTLVKTTVKLARKNHITREFIKGLGPIIVKLEISIAQTYCCLRASLFQATNS